MRACGVFVTLAAALLIPRAACAGDCAPGATGNANCCAHCGCKAPCQEKVCQVVCDVKKEKKTRWIVKCEEFCAPLPGLGRCCGDCCGQCEGSQGGAGCGQACAGGDCESCKQKLVPPKCGPVRTKKTLTKQEYEVEKPAYKCVVVYLCAQCCEACPSGATLPYPPAGTAGPVAPAAKPPILPPPPRLRD